MKRSALIALALAGVLPVSARCGNLTPEITADQAVRAIIGEAANQGQIGMLAVAGAIRNRGTLHGVYGLRAKFVDHQPAWVWARARAAWSESRTNDITGGATHWENVKAFGLPTWARAMKRTVKIGDHQFFKKS